MAKDRFKQMQEQGGGVLTSFQDIVENAKTVAAIEKQAATNPHSLQQQPAEPSALPAKIKNSSKAQEPFRFTRLPNPQIPIGEYNLVTRYCENFANMTRQDFVELAIIEKLHNETLMSDEDFNTRRDAIRNRPPQGHRKGTKNLDGQTTI